MSPATLCTPPKITPGGHWMSIARISGLKANLILLNRPRLRHYLHRTVWWFYFLLGWKLIQPHSAGKCNQPVHWRKLDATPSNPPFLNIPSGHSVISSASAVALPRFTAIIFSFTDSTEVILACQSGNSLLRSRLSGSRHQSSVRWHPLQNRQLSMALTRVKK